MEKPLQHQAGETLRDLARALRRYAPTRRELATLGTILAVGSLFLALNADLPLARNGFMYARTARSIIGLHYNPLPLLDHDSLNYGKPLAFATLAAPLVQVFGASLGTRLASFAGTALFALAAYLFFARANRHLGGAPGSTSLQLGLLFLSPLLFYQFWSAYPDTLFGAAVLAAFLLSERIISDDRTDSRYSILLLGVTIYAAVEVKLFGLMLGVACPLSIIASRFVSLELTPQPVSQPRVPGAVRSTRALVELRWLGPWDGLSRKLPWLIAVFGLLGAAVVGARMGWNPTLNVGAGGTERHSAGLSELGSGLGRLSASETFSLLTSWISGMALCFGLSLLALSFRRPARPWPLRWLLFVAVCVAALVPFGDDAAYNLRYLIPLFPFIALAISRGFASIPRRPLRVGLLVAHACLAALLTLNYNVRSVHLALAPIEDALHSPYVRRGKRLENLRMREHLKIARQIERIDESVAPGELVLWTSSYGGDATHRVIEEMGIRPDIDVGYSMTQIYSRLASGDTVYIAHDIVDPASSDAVNGAFQDIAALTQLENGLARLEPYVALKLPGGQLNTQDGSIQLEAAVPGRMSTQGAAVEFSIDGKPIAVAEQPPYRATWSEATHGRHEATARIFGAGFSLQSAPRVLFVDMTATEVAILDCDDDAEEAENGVTSLGSSDLELAEDEGVLQVVGLRFPKLAIPSGARIKRAYVQFTAYEQTARRTQLVVSAELAPDGRPFRSGDGPGGRSSTLATVAWAPEPWLTDGEHSALQQTPDLTAPVAEVTALPGWREGNALVVLIRGTGTRTARSCDGASRYKSQPSLYVEYEPGGPSGGEPPGRGKGSG